MSAFVKREGDYAITVSNGVYRQVDVYEREGYLFAKEGTGFIQLHASGTTTKTSTRLDHLSVETPLAMSMTGRICLAAQPGSPKLRLIPEAQAVKLGLTRPREVRSGPLPKYRELSSCT